MRWFWQPKIIQKPFPESRSFLYDEKTFYNKFRKDLLEAKHEVIIESPFITTRRLDSLKPMFEKLVNKGVQVFILTRHPHEHDSSMSLQAEVGIQYLEELGVQVLLCDGGHHRKLAILDRKISWEGSLNILSQSHSREFMRRIESKKLTEELFKFLKFDRLNIFRKQIDDIITAQSC